MRRSCLALIPCVFLTALAAGFAQEHGCEDSPWEVDFRFKPSWWQSSICLPDDWQKTIVGRDGELLYDFDGGPYREFCTRISLTPGVGGKAEWVRQELVSPRVPIVVTHKRVGDVKWTEEAFAVTPSGDPAKQAASDSPRYDIVLVRLENTGKKISTVGPDLLVEFPVSVKADLSASVLALGDTTQVACTAKGHWTPGKAAYWSWELDPIVLPPGGKHAFAICITRGKQAEPLALDLAKAEELRAAAEKYWLGVDLPYDHITVPDAKIQALLDSSIRNIYQAREIKKGLPAFQVGPTCYRGLWVVDGSFLLEAITYLNRAKETRSGIQYLLGFQRDDGGFLLIDGHWKETGIVLWAVTRHARLTDDKEWLASVWPKLTRGFEFIRKMRTKANDPKAPNFGLIPDGFSDGGLGENTAEYTNIYWTLAGMRAAIDAARWLGKTEDADSWQKEYDDFHAAFRRAAERDTLTDKEGNRYVPILMGRKDIAPQRAQWAFLHAVFPGKVFAADDPLLRGNMAMLRATEQEGLVFGTGWIADGLWNYFASFYAHAWLWTGDGAKAAESLYAFANHAAPTLNWREEQMPLGKGDKTVGDMPHNWASAEFIRMVRHALVLERGDELHLFEAMPAKWAQRGAEVKVREVLTEFGPISFSLSIAADGKSAELKLDPPRRNPPKRIVVHLKGWTPRADTIDVSTDGPSTTRIPW